MMRVDLKSVQKSRASKMLLVSGILAAFILTTTSCGLDSGQFIDDINDQFQDEGEIYYDPTCLDADGDGWCD